MRGLILAAGVGTRMRPITYWRPKPLVPIADAPLVVHIIRGFVAAGITRIAIVVGHLAEQIQQAVGDGRQWGAEITYIRQQRPAGTADAVLLARDFIGDGPFMLSWGDILVPQEHYGRVREAFGPDTDGVVSVNWVDDPYEGAAVYVADGFVERIVEKPQRGTSTTNYNNAGVFVLRPEILEIAERTPVSPRGEVELPAAIAELIGRGGRLRAVEVRGFWSDVARPRNVIEMGGTVVRYWKTDGIWIEDGAEVGEGTKFEPPVYVGPGARLAAGLGVVGPFACLLSGCQLGEGAVASYCVIGQGTVVGTGCRIEHAYVEDGVVLEPGNVLRGTAQRPLVLPPPT